MRSYAAVVTYTEAYCEPKLSLASNIYAMYCKREHVVTSVLLLGYCYQYAAYHDAAASKQHALSLCIAWRPVQDLCALCPGASIGIKRT